MKALKACMLSLEISQRAATLGRLCRGDGGGGSETFLSQLKLLC